MSEKPEDETTPGAGDALEEAEARPPSGAPREPLIGSDPLGLGGTTDPDAPSRRPRPKFVSLLIEFFRMSRTTAILLVSFVLFGALYLTVKQDPVVGIGTPAGPPTTTENGPADSTDHTDPADPTDPTDDQVPADDPSTQDPDATPTTPTSPQGTTTPPPGRGVTEGTDQQAPQQTPQQQAPQQQAPQQTPQQPAPRAQAPQQEPPLPQTPGA